MFNTKMNGRAPVMSRLSTWAGLIASGVSLLGVALSAEAATYYLDPNGNDVSGTGSIYSPWKTLYKAGQAVPANQGHIIHLKAGTYLLDASLNNYGTRAAVWINPGIFIEGENTATDRARTVIKVRQDASFPGFGVNISTGNFENSPGGVRNITFDGDNYAGAGGLGTLKISNFTVDNVSFKEFSGSALRVAVTGNGDHIVGQDVSGNEIKNCDFRFNKGFAIGGDGWMNSSIHHNNIDHSDIPNPSLANPSPWGSGINIFYVGSTRVHNNTIITPSYTSPFTSWQQQQTADTICFFYSSGGNEIDNNKLGQWITIVGSTTLNGYDKIIKIHDNHIYFPYDVAGSAIELMCDDSDIYNNYIDNCEMGVLTDNGAVQAGDTSEDHINVRVFNNVFRRTFSGALYEGYGIAFRNGTNTTVRNWAIYNNVFDGFDNGFQMDGGGFIRDINVKNNVFLNTGYVVNWGYPTAKITDVNFTNNVWHYTAGFTRNPPPPAGANIVFANNFPGAMTGLGSATDAGLQLSGSLPQAFYTPISGSALPVNAGTTNIAPGITLSGFTGSAPDIGRYEWTSNGTGPVTGSGSISRDVWTNVGGSAISDIPTGSAPQISDTLTSMEIPSYAAENYATRIRGYITAPTTGNYTFWIAGDDQCELWLSTNDQPGGKTKIAYLYDWANPREWNKAVTQKSAVVSLTAGQKCYVEVLHKEGNGGDNLAVGWLKPGQSGTVPSEVVPGSQLSPFTSGGTTPAPLVDRTTNPGGGTVTARARINSNEDEFKAFDDSTNSKWLDNGGTPSSGNPSWIIYQFPNAGYAVEQYTITSANDASQRDPRSWNLQGSNNGTNWATLNSQSGQTFGSRFEKKTYSFSNSTVSKYYRLQITENNGSDLTQLSEIELFSR